MMKIKKKNIALGAVGLLAIFLLLRAGAPAERNAATAPVYATAETGELLVSVKASGEVQSRDANRITPRVKRQVVVSFLVPEGTRVTKDEVIARFATEDIDQRLTEAEATLADRELQVVSARADLDIQELENANALKLSEQAVADAELELKKFREGDEPKDVRAAELKIETTISKRERAIKKHGEAQELLEQGFITEDQVEEDRMAMETAEVDAETAELELKILREYELPLRRNNAQGKLEKAKTELEKTLKKNEVQARNKQQALDNAIRTRDRAEQEFESLKKEREDYEIRAPIDGVVNYGDPNNSWRRGDIDVGMNLNPGTVLMTIPDMTAMQANINVPEADIDRLEAGQTASIYVEAMGRRTFSGQVERVAEVANPGGWISSDVKEFKVQISIEDGNGLRPGFSCSAEIAVERIPDALMLPVQAVFRDGDGWFVYQGSPTRAKRIPVKLGRSSLTHVQITEGLEAGARVLLAPPEEAP
ncbi:MAG: efflux RND transporter periplasmic adaptor subunit [Kiritimatiellia bacterium]